MQFKTDIDTTIAAINNVKNEIVTIVYDFMNKLSLVIEQMIMHIKHTALLLLLEWMIRIVDMLTIFLIICCLPPPKKNKLSHQ